MKKIKNIVLVLFLTLLTVIFLNDGALSTYARIYNNETILEGKIYKSGDTINPSNFTNEWTDDSYHYIRYYTFELSYFYYDEEYNNYIEDRSLHEILSSYGSYDISLSDYNEGNYPKQENYAGNYMITLPKYNNKDVYWKVKQVYSDDEYYIKNIEFVVYDYIKPEADIECDKEIINDNENAECILYLNYKSKVSNFKFKLDTSNFKVSDESALNKWNIASNDNNIYSMTNDLVNLQNNLLEKQGILKFKLTPLNSDKAVNNNNNIKVTNIVYTDDQYTDNELDDLNTTLKVNVVKKQDTKEEQKVIEQQPEKVEKVEENPQTGVDSYIGYIIAGIVLISGIVFLEIKCKKIRKI